MKEKHAQNVKFEPSVTCQECNPAKSDPEDEVPGNDEPAWDCSHYVDRSKKSKQAGCLAVWAVLALAVVAVFI